MTVEQFALGLIAGEGSFYIGLKHRNSGVVNFTATFMLEVYEDNVVEVLVEDLGIGEVYSRDDRDGSIWRITSISDAQELANMVQSSADKYFKSTRKYEQFKKWHRAVEIASENSRYSDEQKKEIVDISFSIADSNNRRTSKEEWYNRIEN